MIHLRPVAARIVAAVERARREGYLVGLGELGASCASTLGPVRWESERGVVNPLGAVLLALQPPACSDPARALAIALDVDPSTASGLLDGFDCEVDEKAADGPEWRLYAEGFRLGCMIRIGVADQIEKQPRRRYV